jgi:hypothetical protein
MAQPCVGTPGGGGGVRQVSAPPCRAASTPARPRKPTHSQVAHVQAPVHIHPRTSTCVRGHTHDCTDVCAACARGCAWPWRSTPPCCSAAPQVSHFICSFLRRRAAATPAQVAQRREVHNTLQCMGPGSINVVAWHAVETPAPGACPQAPPGPHLPAPLFSPAPPLVPLHPAHAGHDRPRQRALAAVVGRRCPVPRSWPARATVPARGTTTALPTHVMCTHAT